MERIRARAHRRPRAAIVVVAMIATSAIATPGAHAQTAPAPSAPVNASVASGALALAAPVVGLAATPSGHGYWRAAADGGVLGAGDAKFHGSAVGKPHDTIVAIAVTPTGHGYWLVDRRGLVLNFGDAVNRGSMSGHTLNRPIVGMAATPDGHGYWLVASDGGIFGYNAPFEGSTGSIRLNQPIVGIGARPQGNGYTLVAADGGLFRFGAQSPFFGSAAHACPGSHAVAVAMSPGAVGYWIAFADGRTYAFSPSSAAPKCAPNPLTKTGLMTVDLVSRLNAERAARGSLHLPPLVWDATLASYASAWAANMAAHGFRHSDIGALLGPYNYVGENIAAGSAGTTDGGLHVAWMNSTGHRENILAPGFTRVGVGVFCAADGSLWLVEDFGHPTAAGSPAMAPSIPPVNPIVRPETGTHC